ncbi:MAG: pyruvate kinase [Parcubacteria group bacterium]|nr:pyruvate kinase [Parcubacteria group bacterium]
MHIKKTKIVATIGSASSSERELIGMVRAGMNVARLNFSHGTHEEHAKLIDTIRGVSDKLKTPLAIIQDLMGPKIRIGDFGTEQIHLKKGADFTFTTETCLGDERRAYVNFHALPKEVSKDMDILLDDGKIKLRIVSVGDTEIRCKVVDGGVIRGRRGVNVPGAHLSIGSLTEKDKKDLVLGVKKGVDFVALSFVQTADDVKKLRALLGQKGTDAGIIAKIETEEAVKNIDAIIEAADGIMVARGDLAVEIPKEDVPLVQKTIIKKSIDAGKPVITATQMLDSMTTSPVPTRAEVNDVANAILDGTDAVMLSGETAVGDHPVLVIETMSRIALRTEGSALYEEEVAKFKRTSHGTVDAISASVASVAQVVSAKAIVALSEKGFTPRMVSRYKPSQPILVLTPHESVRHKIALSFGCVSEVVPPIKTVTEAMALSRKILLKKKILKKGDVFIIAAGMPFGKTGGTNMLLVQTA